MIRTPQSRLALATLLAAAALIAADSPRALAAAGAGLWEIGQSADGHDAQKICLADPAILTQWEQRTGRCTRVVLSDSESKAVVQYTCSDGGFGRSDVTMLTPRSLRIATQGISKSYPFAYTLHARRVGDCTSH